MITFTEAEKQLITRLSVVGGWANPEAEPLKAKIRAALLPAGAVTFCCYCRLSMHQWHKMSIDTEHILPKGKFPQYIFKPVNLNVSCKRCNMGIKREDTSFFLGAEDGEDPFRSEHYAIIHPNLDQADNHLRIETHQVNAKLMVVYQIVGSSSKGRKTYEYFELEKLEINSIDEAQGLPAVTPSETLPPEFARELNVIIDSITP